LAVRTNCNGKKKYIGNNRDPIPGNSRFHRAAIRGASWGIFMKKLEEIGLPCRIPCS